jgi:hypothetical protein
MQNEDGYKPVTVQVPLGDLRHLCRLAIEAGNELQDVARAEYPGQTTLEVRRRNRDVADAQRIIDAANVFLTLIEK